MTRQLRLIENPTPWKLDTDTRDRGRKGISAARAALAAAPTLFSLDTEAA
ncbi:MAG: hypothetical protein P8N02_18230 [Actinomycetota bacterium]|jgi:hypothetical protein|nr:hypothetical protein [Actinomycetota bacterium]